MPKLHAGDGGAASRGGGRGDDVSTLRLSPMEIDRLKRELDATSSGTGQSKRAYKRWPFECKSIRMELQHPGGAATTLSYVPRNISREGIGLLHSSFVYTGTRCVVFLPHPIRGEVPTIGTVTRCRHFKGKIHELGIKFDQPIDVREFLGLDGTEGCSMLENVAPETLTGGVLLIEPGEMDRALVRQHLKDTNMTVTSAMSAAEGLKRAHEGYDVVLCALELPDGDGLEALYQLRSAGIQTPFLLLCPSAGTAAVRDRIQVLQPDGVICKPVPAQTLLSVIGELLFVRGKELGGGGSAIFSSLSPKDPLVAYIPEYIKQLHTIAQQLSDCACRNDVTECSRLIFQVRGSAPTFGFSSLAEAAEQAHNALNATQSVVDASGGIRKVISMCYRVKARRMAA